MRSNSIQFGVLISILFFLNSCSKLGSTVDEPDLLDINGQSVDFKGKITVVNIWATWCGTCRQEIPALNAICQKYKNDTEIQFIAFSDEKKEVVEPMLNFQHFDYRQVVDASDFTSTLKTRLVKTYPQNIILNQKGEVMFEVTDGTQNIYQTLDDQIQKLKNQNH